MYKLLIPLLVCLLGSATMLHAQVPKNISVQKPLVPASMPASMAEMMCNDAGTFALGAFSGQSNDADLTGPQDTIFLCFGDQIQIDHNGNADLSGDPNPATPPGVGWAFYNCAPTIMGDNLATILGDPCILNTPPATNGIWVASDQPSGDILFNNNGNLQTAFNAGQPILIHFAPITLDNFATQGFEGTPSGPCVNVNTGVAFKTVYLNRIQESGVSVNFGNDCLGKFRIEGGYPQWNGDALYTIDIALASDPTIKAVIHTAKAQLFHSADVIFSVPQSGVYTVTVQDGKSCDHTFNINMGACQPSDNVLLAIPDTVSPPGSQICVPVTVANFDLVGASFSLNWDPTVLEYQSVQNPNLAIGTFNASNLNTQNTASGQLGAIVYDQVNLGDVISIPDGGTLFEVCFNVLGQLGDCTPIGITNDPSAVNIEDQNGQAVALTADVGEVCVDFLPLSFATEVINVTCNDSAQIRITVTGGNPPYDVTRQLLPAGAIAPSSIATAGGSFTTPLLPEGEYRITVRDANGVGVLVEDTVTISTISLGVGLDVVTQLPTCNGGDDGVVTASVLLENIPQPNPGAPRFSFAWSPANVPSPSSAVQTGVPAGNYAVTVTDNTTGCTSTASGTMGQPSLIRDQVISVTNASCSGVCDASISYTAQGGTPFSNAGTDTYDYNWEFTPSVTVPPVPVANGTGNANPFVLTNLCAGSYFVTITDQNGCSATDEIQVTNLRVITLSTTAVENASCNGVADGRICVQVSESPASPNPNFSFFWAPQGFTQTGTGLNSCYEDLPPGTYNILAVDASGCADTMDVAITEPAPLELDTISIQQPSCVTQSNGSISVFASGGTGGPVYDFLWSNGVNNFSVNNLSPDTFSVTVTDINGCQDSLEFVLTLPEPPSIEALDSISVTCGNDGCLTIFSSTATNYVWQNIDGSFLPSITSQVCDLDGGTYVVTLIDNFGCAQRDTLTLATIDRLVFTDTTFLEPSCAGLADGRISVGVSGGNPNYTFQWTPGNQSTATLINVGAGSYNLVVTDSEGCTLSGTFDLEEPPAIVNTFSNISGVSCFKECDGTATAVVNYATTPPTTGNFSFVWQGGSTDSLRTDLCGGINRVTITDGNNCFLVDSVFIDSPSEVGFSTLDSIPTSCFGASDGSVVVAGDGGNGGPYSYLWNTGSTQTTVANLEADVYTVTITDAQGCTGTYTIEVTQPDSLLIQEGNSSEVLCFGGSDGILSVNVTGGTGGPFQFEWTNGTDIVSTTQEAEMLPAGTYSVTVTDGNGCSGVLNNLVLTDPPPVQGAYIPWEELLCNGDETTLVVDTIFGGAGGPYQFSVDFGVQLAPDFPITLGGGEHYVTYFDVRNCEFTDTIFIDEPAPIVVSFDPQEIEIELGDSTKLTPLITGAVVDTFLWAPAQFLLNPTVLNPTVYTFESETFTLVVFDENGCSGTGSVQVNVDPNRNIYMPNVFIPNNPSGLNDHFNVNAGRGVEKIKFFQVFNRWGELMYERRDFLPDADNLAEGWDGRYKGDIVNPGVYVYVVEVCFLDGRVLLYRGDVTVMR